MSSKIKLRFGNVMNWIGKRQLMSLRFFRQCSTIKLRKFWRRKYKMKNAVIYARYSSERQNEQSIESQLSVCNEYTQRNGLTIIDSYIDKAMTGTNDYRPSFQRMLSDAEKSKAWEIVLVYA